MVSKIRRATRPSGEVATSVTETRTAPIIVVPFAGSNVACGWSMTIRHVGWQR